MTRKLISKAALILVGSLLTVGVAIAEEPTSRPTVMVSAQVVVKGDKISLGDIAQISATDSALQPLVDQLSQITIDDAPPPRATKTLVGEAVLNTIRDAGVDPETIGYSIPRVIKVEREGRLISTSEVLDAIRANLGDNNNKDLQVKQVEFQPLYAIPTGETRIKVETMGRPNGGKLPLRVEVFVNELSAARFLASAVVDYWRDVPVLSRSLERGMLISPNDLQMVRVNLNQYPDDIVTSAQEAVGRQTKARINAGEAIRQSLVDIPPVIPRGQRVTVVYETGGLKATASAIAMEDGFTGGSVLVQNDSSKKLLRGRVVSPELVEIRTE